MLLLLKYRTQRDSNIPHMYRTKIAVIYTVLYYHIIMCIIYKTFKVQDNTTPIQISRKSNVLYQLRR